MATVKEAAQAYDELMGALRRAETKARGAIESARMAEQIKSDIFADADLKAKVKAIADARGQSITGLSNQVKAAKDAETYLVGIYPDPVREPAPIAE